MGNSKKVVGGLLSRPAFFGVVYVALIPLFSVAFRIVEGFGGKPLSSIVDFIHFSTVTITTLGYGDTYPVDALAKVFCSLEAVLGILCIGFFLNAVSVDITRRAKDESERALKSLRDQVYAALVDAPNLTIKYLQDIGLIHLGTNGWRTVQFGELYVSEYPIRHEIKEMRRGDDMSSEIENIFMKHVQHNVENFVARISSLKSRLHGIYGAHAAYIDPQVVNATLTTIRQCEYIEEMFIGERRLNHSDGWQVRAANNQVLVLLKYIEEMRTEAIRHADKVKNK